MNVEQFKELNYLVPLDMDSFDNSSFDELKRLYVSVIDKEHIINRLAIKGLYKELYMLREKDDDVYKYIQILSDNLQSINMINYLIKNKLTVPDGILDYCTNGGLLMFMHFKVLGLTHGNNLLEQIIRHNSLKILEYVVSNNFSLGNDAVSKCFDYGNHKMAEYLIRNRFKPTTKVFNAYVKFTKFNLTRYILTTYVMPDNKFLRKHFNQAILKYKQNYVKRYFMAEYESESESESEMLSYDDDDV